MEEETSYSVGQDHSFENFNSSKIQPYFYVPPKSTGENTKSNKKSLFKNLSGMTNHIRYVGRS